MRDIIMSPCSYSSPRPEIRGCNNELREIINSSRDPHFTVTMPDLGGCTPKIGFTMFNMDIFGPHLDPVIDLWRFTGREWSDMPNTMDTVSMHFWNKLKTNQGFYNELTGIRQEYLYHILDMTAVIRMQQDCNRVLRNPIYEFLLHEFVDFGSFVLMTHDRLFG